MHRHSMLNAVFSAHRRTATVPWAFAHSTTRRWASNHEAATAASTANAAASSSSSFVRENASFANAGGASQGGDSNSNKAESRAQFWGRMAGYAVLPVAAGIMWRLTEPAPTPNAADGESPAVAKPPAPTRPSLGGPFTMTDCEMSRPVTDEEVLGTKAAPLRSAADGAPVWTLLYFGFAQCAEVCPRNLRFMADVARRAAAKAAASNADATDGASKAAAPRIQIVFVSVDAIRDTPQALSAYMHRQLDPQLEGTRVSWRGLCGTDAQVSQACRAWRVYYTSMEETEEERLAREAKGMTLEEAIGSRNERYQLDHSAAVYLVHPSGTLRDFFFEEMGADHAADRIDLHFSDAYGLDGPMIAG